MSPHSCIRPTAPPRDEATGSIDLSAAAEAATAFLAALGLPDDASVRGDAGWRLARTYATVLATEPPPPATEHLDADGGDLVVIPAITLGTLCPDHLLPITALARVGYLPDRLVAPTPIIADAMRYLAAPPQSVARLAGRLADWLHAATHAHGVGVTVQVEHTCPLPPGPSAADVTGVGTALRGRVRDDPAIRAELLSLTNVPATQRGCLSGRRPR
ncbi:GTP cyclohydrolase I [Amycolatopsis echigonensis]|uniref:GTP cyclohydrolase 1 n=1 Tax=Amycolatopsis echigonensis TaxID=2576905 RepID=A0A2N3X195_9PSEU|nr:GTP cyclohydrolase I [Amycolatopsis niigatensis]PKV99879.1 GTP cyclohydrolase I [Amycolatopsis niigatensis]